MNNKKIVIGSFIILCISALIVLILCFFINKDERYTQKCYFDNEQAFDSLAEYFSQSYEPSLNCIEYNLNDSTLTRYYSEKSISCECDNEFINSKLTELHNNYKNDSNSTIFSFVHAYYDNSGNMLLYIIVKSNKRNDSIRNNYLVYIDESYDGHSSDLSIDTYNISRKPFSGNWCYWSADIPAG